MLAACNFTGIPVPHTINGFRLTVDPGGAPVPTTDILSATVLRAAAYSGGQIGLLDAAGNGTVYTHSTATFAMPTFSGLGTKNYDSFACLDGAGALVLEPSAAWTNDTTRATALAYINGIWVKATDYTRRWMGSYRLAGTSTMHDTAAFPNLFSADNRVMRRTYAPGPIASVSSSSTTYAVTASSFSTIVLNGSPTPIMMTAGVTLILNNPTSGAFSDVLYGIRVGASLNYTLGAFPNDFSTGYQRVTGVNDVPLPFGATTCDAIWAMTGGTGSMKISSSERGGIGNPASCSLQLLYMR